MPITAVLSHTTAALLKVATVFGLFVVGTLAEAKPIGSHHSLLEQVLPGRSQHLPTAGLTKRSSSMKIQVQVPHELKTKKVKEKLNNLSAKYNMEIEWKDSNTGTGTVSYGGFEVPGEVQLNEKSIRMIVEVPRAARFFQTKIKNELQNTLFQTLNS